jgi:hypothetical protein
MVLRPGAGEVESTLASTPLPRRGSGWWIRVVDEEGGATETIEQNLTGGPGLGADLDLTETLRLCDAHLAGTDAFASGPASTHEATQAGANGAFAFPIQIGSATFGAILCTAVTRVVRAAPHRPRNDGGHLGPQSCLATRFMGTDLP